MKRFLRCTVLFALLCSFCITPPAYSQSQVDPEPDQGLAQSSVAPFGGWLVFESGGKAEAAHQPEINIGKGNGSYTIEGWLKDPFQSISIGQGPEIYKVNSFNISLIHSYNGTPFPGKHTYGVVFMGCVGYCYGYNHTLATCTDNTCAPKGWFHYAYVYDQAADTASFFWNGKMFTNEAKANPSTGALVLKLAGAMDEIRISNTTRYSAPFAAQAAPFQCDDATLALWHFDEVEGSTVFHDSCGTEDNAFTGISGAHTEGVVNLDVYLPLVTR